MSSQATNGAATAAAVRCERCGRSRVLTPVLAELARVLVEVGEPIVCATCRASGDPGSTS